MRISDWSLYLCSSDLDVILVDGEPVGLEGSVSMSVGTMQLEGQPGHIVVTDHLGNVSKLVFQPKWVNAYVTPSPEDPTWTGILGNANGDRSEEHTSELQSLMRISYAVYCLKKKKIHNRTT